MYALKDTKFNINGEKFNFKKGQEVIVKGYDFDLVGMFPSHFSNDKPDVDLTDLNSMNISTLRELAKDKGLKGYSSLSKDELIELLNS